MPILDQYWTIESILDQHEFLINFSYDSTLGLGWVGSRNSIIVPGKAHEKLDDDIEFEEKFRLIY